VRPPRLELVLLAAVRDGLAGAHVEALLAISNFSSLSSLLFLLFASDSFFLLC